MKKLNIIAALTIVFALTSCGKSKSDEMLETYDKLMDKAMDDYNDAMDDYKDMMNDLNF